MGPPTGRAQPAAAVEDRGTSRAAQCTAGDLYRIGCPQMNHIAPADCLCADHAALTSVSPSGRVRCLMDISGKAVTFHSVARHSPVISVHRISLEEVDERGRTHRFCGGGLAVPPRSASRHGSHGQPCRPADRAPAAHPRELPRSMGQSWPPDRQGESGELRKDIRISISVA
jgi:hypothetical protein